MILDYVKFKNFPLTAEIPLFLVHGNPRNISNEIERDISSFYKKLGFKRVNYVIDDDTQTEDVKSNLHEQSLFEEKKLFVINIIRYGQIAQSVEQRTENPRVGGSIPSLATTS